MYKFKRVLLFATAIAICMTFTVMTGNAAFDDFSDGVGHWAQEELRRAVDDGLLEGYDDGLLHPNDPVTCAQILTLIGRMLNPQKTVEYSELNLSGDEWYADSAVLAAAMGVDFDKNMLKEATMPRADAFELIADAFQLVPAESDLSALDDFSDTEGLSNDAAKAMAAMVSGGYIEGYQGKLTPDSPITRAEFVTVLYRIAGVFANAQELPENIQSGVIISDNGYIMNETFEEPVWIDCSAENVTLWNVNAKTIVFRSQVSAITITGTSNIDRLVIAGGTGGGLSVMPLGLSKVGTLIIGDADASNVSVGGNVERVEVTGDGLNISISAWMQEMVVAGSDCSLTVYPGYNLGSVRFTSESRDNNMTFGSTAKSITVGGSGNSVTGYGYAETITVTSSRGEVTLNHKELVDNRVTGVEEARIKLETTDVLPAGETLSVKATIDNPYELTASATWYVDGENVKEEKLEIGPQESEFEFTYDYEYTKNMELESIVTLTLRYENEEGEATDTSESVELALENYGDEYYRKTEEEVLALVTSKYAGDYTLEWAENHDYEDEDKVTWVNAKGYSSSTEYLIWINRTYQRVNVFQGSEGNWELIHTYIVGTGADSTPTPVGVYTVFGRSPYGWTTATYNVRPVVNFKVGSGYAFHSRLYDPGHNYLTSTAIGYPVSHGCIRMYDEDVQWIYDNIPNGTTVVVH